LKDTKLEFDNIADCERHARRQESSRWGDYNPSGELVCREQVTPTNSSRQTSSAQSRFNNAVAANRQARTTAEANPDFARANAVYGGGKRNTTRKSPSKTIPAKFEATRQKVSVVKAGKKVERTVWRNIKTGELRLKTVASDGRVKFVSSPAIRA